MQVWRPSRKLRSQDRNNIVGVLQPAGVAVCSVHRGLFWSVKISAWAFSMSASVRTQPPNRHVQCEMCGRRSMFVVLPVHDIHEEVAPRRCPDPLLLRWRPRQARRLPNSSLRRHNSSSFHTSLFNIHLHAAGGANQKTVSSEQNVLTSRNQHFCAID